MAVLHASSPLGPCLGTLDTIKGNTDNIDDQFQIMLITWLKMVQPKPTLERFTDTLQSPAVGYGHLAEYL